MSPFIFGQHWLNNGREVALTRPKLPRRHIQAEEAEAYVSKITYVLQGDNTIPMSYFPFLYHLPIKQNPGQLAENDSRERLDS